MKKVIRLTESDLYRLVKRVIKEQDENLSSAESLFKHAMNANNIGEFADIYFRLMAQIKINGTDEEKRMWETRYEKELEKKINELHKNK